MLAVLLRVAVCQPRHHSFISLFLHPLFLNHHHLRTLLGTISMDDGGDDTDRSFVLGGARDGGKFAVSLLNAINEDYATAKQQSVEQACGHSTRTSASQS